MKPGTKVEIQHQPEKGMPWRHEFKVGQIVELAQIINFQGKSLHQFWDGGDIFQCVHQDHFKVCK